MIRKNYKDTYSHNITNTWVFRVDLISDDLYRTCLSWAGVPLLDGSQLAAEVKVLEVKIVDLRVRVIARDHGVLASQGASRIDHGIVHGALEHKGGNGRHGLDLEVFVG